MAETGTYFLKAFPINGVAQPEIDIVEYFPGLRVSKVTGLLDQGQNLAVYSERIPESEALQVYISPNPRFSNIEIEMTVVFKGDDRYSSWQSFKAFISGKKLTYRDTVRNVKIDVFLSSALKPSDEIYKGSSPYFMVPIKFTAMTGKSTNI